MKTNFRKQPRWRRKISEKDIALFYYHLRWLNKLKGITKIHKGVAVNKGRYIFKIDLDLQIINKFINKKKIEDFNLPPGNVKNLIESAVKEGQCLELRVNICRYWKYSQSYYVYVSLISSSETVRLFCFQLREITPTFSLDFQLYWLLKLPESWEDYQECIEPDPIV